MFSSQTVNTHYIEICLRIPRQLRMLISDHNDVYLQVYTRTENGAECIFNVLRNLTLQCNKVSYMYNC